MFLPKLCHICGLEMGSYANHPLWCNSCQRYFTLKPRCRRCGLPMLRSGEMCGLCITSPPPWHNLYCAADYAYPVSRLIQKIKINKQINLLPIFINQLNQTIPSVCRHVITVPMLWHKQMFRGFNLSETMAYQLRALHPSISVLTTVFHKHRHTPTQKSLSRDARLVNVRRAFSLHHPPKVHEVAIIDDVVTSGATAKHLSELLLEVGVKKIDIYCLCRTPS